MAVKKLSNWELNKEVQTLREEVFVLKSNVAALNSAIAKYLEKGE